MKRTNTKHILGKNHRHVLGIISDLSLGLGIKNTKYYGGSVSYGQRYISIGRECSLHFDTPWRIVDVRHAGALFKQDHGDRLGYCCLRAFNKALHDLIRKGYIMPVPTKIVAQKRYEDLLRQANDCHNQGTRMENLRFVVLTIPDALSAN